MRNYKLKRTLAMLTVVVMSFSNVLSSLPMNAFAAEETEVEESAPEPVQEVHRLGIRACVILAL